MHIEVYRNGNIFLYREAFEPCASTIEDMVKLILESPDCPDNFKLAPGKDAIDDITRGMFDSRSCAVTFLVDGKKQGNLINDESVHRFNMGLAVHLQSCSI